MGPEPTTTEWVAASAAAALVVVVGGLHLLRPARRPVASAGSRVAGFLLAALAWSSAVAAAVLVGAGLRAARIDPAELGEDRPVGAFARYLVAADPATTERVGRYGAAVLLPLAATLAVLALAAVDAGRSIGQRAVAAVVCGALLVVAVLVATGDAGPLASRAAVAVAVLAGGAVAALVVDELTHRRRPRLEHEAGQSVRSSA